MSRRTRKLYYENPALTECTTTVVKIGLDWVELESTVAYPEGGGQEADHGIISLPDGREINFRHVRKMYGSRLVVPDFPDIQVDGIIEHVIAASDLPNLRDLKEGLPVTVRIDRLRRAQLSLSHPASHLLYLGVSEIRPTAIDRLLGCHIRTESARFDFNVRDRFTTDEVQEIERIANGMVDRACDVHVYPHNEHADARYWRCDGNVIPCGGTHILSTATIGKMEVRRKNLGKDKDRLSCFFAQAIPDVGVLTF